MGVPSYRQDLAREPDLIEEVCRMAGIQKIPPAFRLGNRQFGFGSSPRSVNVSSSTIGRTRAF